MYRENFIRNSRKINWHLFGAIALFLILHLRVCDLGISWRDNGFLLYASERILEGKMPYRDFFLTTTPGTYYFRALTLKLFGDQLIIGRIMYILFSTGILVLFINLFKTFNLFYFVSVFVIILILYAPGGYAFYNIQTLFLIMLAAYILNREKESLSHYKLIVLGMIAGLTFLFKQSVGVLLLMSILLIVFITSKKSIHSAIYIVFGTVTFLFPFTLYLLLNSALDDFLYQTIVFAGQVKTGASLKIIVITSIASLLLLIHLFSQKLKSKRPLN